MDTIRKIKEELKGAANPKTLELLVDELEKKLKTYVFCVTEMRKAQKASHNKNAGKEEHQSALRRAFAFEGKVDKILAGGKVDIEKQEKTGALIIS